MVNLTLLASNDSTELLTVQGASQLTGGLLSERKIWQLVKEGRLSFINDGDDSGIPIAEMMLLIGNDSAAPKAA